MTMTDVTTVEALVAEAQARNAARTAQQTADALRLWQQQESRALYAAIADILPGQLLAILTPRIVPPADYTDHPIAIIHMQDCDYALRRLVRGGGMCWAWRRLEADAGHPAAYPEVVVNLMVLRHTERADALLAGLADAARAERGSDSEESRG